MGGTIGGLIMDKLVEIMHSPILYRHIMVQVRVAMGVPITTPVLHTFIYLSFVQSNLYNARKLPVRFQGHCLLKSLMRDRDKARAPKKFLNGSIMAVPLPC